MADKLIFKTGTIGNYSNPTDGTVYFATDTDNRAYIYLNGNNIVPRMADLRNGGFGADLTGAAAYSVLLRGNGSYDTTYSAPASGAFYATSTSSKPKFGTLPIAQGGTARTSLTTGYLLYGAGTSAVGLLAPGTKGQVLMSSSTAPVYVSPAMSWTDGTENGPVFNFVFNGTTFSGSAIPKASTTTSGIITTEAQTMIGEKTWNSVTYASGIYPRSSGSYSLGYYTSSSDHKIWNNVISHYLKLYDANNVLNGYTTYTSGTSDTAGAVRLYLGNPTASGTAGNSQGNIYLYGSSSGYGRLYYVASATSTNQMIPQASGNVMISATSVYDNTGTYYLPFYSATGNTMKLGYNSGYRFYTVDGTTSVTGTSRLQLGNATPTGTADNKRGYLLLYGDNTGYTILQSNKSNSTTNYTLSLPAASGELVYHTEDAALGGASAAGRLLQISAAGQISNDTTSDIASKTKLMYLLNGLLTASDAGVGSGTKPVYLSGGEITASTSNVGSGIKPIYMASGTLSESTETVGSGIKIMYLNGGTLTASTSDVGSSVKPVYMLDGEITVSSGSVAKSTQLMYMTGGTLTASTADVGSSTQPVYLLDGVVTAAGAYTSLLTAFSRSTNTLSLTVGGTTKTTTAVGSVSNTWANGTSSGPTIKTTVNGVAGSAVAMPSASYSYSGAVTTGTQTFKGVKTFGDGMAVSASGSSTDCATFTYDASTDTLTISFP